MSFFNSKPWAKIPTDLLENKLMFQAERHLPESLNYVPVLFYLAGATKADDDGIFDIDNGLEFASLCKVKSPENIFKVAAVMVQARIFAHVPNTSFYIFTEWEYATRQTARTLSYRFDLAKKKAQQKATENSYFYGDNLEPSTKIDNLVNNNNYTENKNLNTKQSEVNECFNTIQGEKTANDRIEEIREDKNRQDKIISDEIKNTHTRIDGVVQDETEKSRGFLGNPQDFSAQENKKSDEIIQNQKIMSVPSWEIVPNSENEKPVEVQNQEKQEATFVPTKTIKTLGDFFKQNNVAYNELKGSKIVEQIAYELSQSCKNDDETNVLAERFCKEFKAMHDAPETDHWHNIPLMPAYMIKDVVWAQLNSRVTRIYGSVSNQNQNPNTVEQAKKDYAEHIQDLQSSCNSQDAEYIRLGIDPEDPNRIQKMLIKKAMQGTEVNYGEHQ